MTGFTPTTEAVKARYVLFPPDPPEWLRPTRDHVDGAAFDRWLATLNPWPALDERYDAAKEAGLGDQLRPEELTERVRIELQNAFAAGALWQYGRGQTSASNTPKESE